MSQEKKQRVARAAIEYIDDDMVVGVGTGSTVNCFIDELAQIRHESTARSQLGGDRNQVKTT